MLVFGVSYVKKYDICDENDVRPGLYDDNYDENNDSPSKNDDMLCQFW